MSPSLGAHRGSCCCDPKGMHVRAPVCWMRVFPRLLPTLPGGPARGNGWTGQLPRGAQPRGHRAGSCLQAVERAHGGGPVGSWAARGRRPLARVHPPDGAHVKGCFLGSGRLQVPPCDCLGCGRSGLRLHSQRGSLEGGSRVPAPHPRTCLQEALGQSGTRPRGQEVAPGKEREPIFLFSPQHHEALTPAPGQGLPHEGSLAPGGLACTRRPRALRGRGRRQGAPMGASLGPRRRWAVAQGGSGPRWAEWGGDPGGRDRAAQLCPGVSAPGWPCACGQVAGASGTSFSFPLGKGITQPLPEVAGTQMG